MSRTFTCKVISAGASVEPPDPDTPANSVFILLQSSQLQGQQEFYASDAMKREILAVALAAVATGRAVSATVDPPPYVDDSGRAAPTPQCYGLRVLTG